MTVRDPDLLTVDDAGHVALAWDFACQSDARSFAASAFLVNSTWQRLKSGIVHVTGYKWTLTKEDSPNIPLASRCEFEGRTLVAEAQALHQYPLALRDYLRDVPWLAAELHALGYGALLAEAK